MCYNIKKELAAEHGGFAITFEVLCTFSMMFMMLFFILFVMMVMNGQRYMNTVLTTTAAEAARWGGVNSRAYIVNISNESLLTSAQNQLNAVVPEFNARIGGVPNYITYDGQKITLWIQYSLPPFWASIGTVSGTNGNYNMYNDVRNLSMTIQVNSIMVKGDLLH